ncbi:MAG TPA: tRNA preQ1(34) S-adenosylmethionine ribosyltransferase-isomerase QueA [Acidimicrobiales bacterium]
MDTADFDYDLPEARIAQVPVEPRDAARLLVDGGPGGDVHHRHVSDLPALLEPGDLVVVNRTRVMAARLHLVKLTGGAAEVLLLEERPDVGEGWWEALVRPGRRLPPGTVLSNPVTAELLTVEVGDALDDGVRLVRLSTNWQIDLADGIEATGEMPLPPYITEALADPERYQTVYADRNRAESSAAPTAGLHLTPTVLEALIARGIEIASVDLVVGLGTFRPMTAAKVEDHAMHAERYRVPEETFDAVARTQATGGRVVAVGTTTVRALESVAATGELEGHTELFIHGDYPFQVVDRLLTNFHLPRSSLLVMVDAFAGPRWRDLYATALAEEYRFLSFGDAMLLTRHDRWSLPGAEGSAT